jgi:hypothetical protein
MDVFIKLDSLQYRNAVKRLIVEKGADAKLLLREEARLLIRDILKLTPPQTQQQGALSVEVNLKRAFSPLVASDFSGWGNKLGKRIARLIRKKDVAQLNFLFSKIGGKLGGKRIIGLNDMPAIHKRLTNERGRVSKSSYVALPQDFKAYLKIVKARVGWAKAGWNAAATAVGLAMPGYVTRHSGNRLGSIQFSPAPKLGVTLLNYSSKMPRYQAKVDYAVQRRYHSFLNEAKRILAGGQSRRGSFAGTATGAASQPKAA